MATTRPTGPVEWAANSDSIKEETTAKQKTHGWTTSDDTLSGTKPRPVIKNQNYWQDTVASYVNFVSENSPDDDIDSFDLWEWDTANLGQLDTRTSGALKFIDLISESGGNLEFKKNTSTLLTDGDPWLDFQPETQFGGMHYEFQDMLARGIAIRLVDGDDAEWTIYNAGSDNRLADTASNLASLPEGSLKAVTNSLTFTIQVASTDIAIQKVKDGVTTFPSDFVGFVSLTISNFATKNPGGIRAVLYGDVNLDFSTGGKSPSKMPRQRWIRPANISKVTKGFNPNIQWPISWEPGKRYSVNFWLSNDSLIQPPYTAIGDVIAGPTGTDYIHSYGMSSGLNAIDIKFEFTGPFQVTRKAIALTETIAIEDQGLYGPIETVYPYAQDMNILTVEEINA